LLGHPVGLYTLFFAEMWERFSFYGMRALLVLYMIKDFMAKSDKEAYAVYGAYTALVYATPFIGGMLADRLLGMRRAVILGGLLMAAGHLLMTVRDETAFYYALALLIVGNGFFKPNISTIVGTLYPAGSPRRDGGFTIFYMGINLGAALAPLICGFVGERYGWHYGFGLATVGMLTGVAVFVAPVRLTQILILGGALLTAASMLFIQKNPYEYMANVVVAAALVLSAVVAFVAINRGGIPEGAGAPPDKAALQRKIGPLRADFACYLGALLSVPVFALLVARNALAGYVLAAFGTVAIGSLIVEAMRRDKVERDRLFVVLILMVFSMLFWTFFEQAGSSMNNFADRNVDRVLQDREVSQDEVGSQIRFRISPVTNDPELVELPPLTQEQLGRQNDSPEMAERITRAIRFLESQKEQEARLSDDELAEVIERVNPAGPLSFSALTALRDAAGRDNVDSDLRTLEWQFATDNVGMGIGGEETPASVLQAANPIYILVFGVVFTMLWPFLAERGIDPSTPVKFGLGLLQLGLGFVAVWYGAQQSNSVGMVAVPWLLLAYLLHTTGELCLSPIGLSMVTKLSPKQIVSTVMGAWFLATAFSQYLAAEIAKLTGVGHEEGGPQVIPPPIGTVNLYGDVFGIIAIAAIVSALICFALSPLLTKWMHPEIEQN
jgi:POT family proton-dependent oligopeptide transporter